MKLPSPIAGLANRCETMCDHKCCGIDAYDFSPIQIASYLTLMKRVPTPGDVRVLRDQLDLLEKRSRRNGITIEAMNQIFTPETAQELVDEIRANLDIALDLIKQSEARRKRRREPNTL